MEEDYVMVNGRKTIPRKMYLGSKLYHGVNLNLHYSIGLKQRLQAYVFNEESLVYMNGHHIVLHDISKKKQTFMMRKKDEDDVAVMNYCLNDKQVLSLCLGLKNNIKNYATIKIYKSNNKFFTLLHQHLAFGVQVKDVQFIEYAKYTVTLCCSATNSHYISLYKTSKEQLIAYVDQREIYNNLFGSFQDVSTIAIIGPKVVKLWKYNPENKQLEDTDLQFEGTPICGVQIRKNYCILNQEGVLQFIKKNKIQDTFNLLNHFNHSPTVISATVQGVAVGFQNAPILAIIDYHKGKLTYRKQYQLNISNFVKMTHLHVGPEDSYITLMAQLSGNESIENNNELYLFNYGIVDIISTALRDPFEQLFPLGVHKSKMICIDSSPCKPILCMLSEERVLKVWEFSYSRGEFKCLYSHQLHEVPLCLALHPTSFQCAIGYREGLKFYFTLHDDLKQVYYENLKQCSAVRYTPGGHLLAVGSQNQILLYNPYTYTQLYNLTGHSGSIQTLEWIDNLLVSSCSQGLVIGFSNQQRVIEHSFKAHKIYCQTYDPEYDFLIGCYIDQKVRIFNEKGLNLFYEMDVYPYTYVSVQIIRQLDIILFGTACGKIRSYLWPFTQFQDDQEFNEIQLHSGPITTMKLSADLSFLMTGSEDGSVMISKVREYYEGKEITATEMVGRDLDKQNFSLANLYNFNMLAFVSKSSQDAKREMNKELDFKISNLKSDIEDQKQDITLKYQKYKKQLEEQNSQGIADQKEYLSQIMENSDTRLKQLDYDLENMRNSHQKRVNEMKQKSDENLMQLYMENDHLKNQKSKILEKFRIESDQINTEFNNLYNSQRKDYDQKYNDLVTRYNQSNDALKLDELKFKEVFTETEKEYQILINREKEKKLVILEDLLHKSEETRSQNTKHKKAINNYQARKQEVENLIRDTKTQLEHLQKERSTFLQANKDVQQKLKEEEKLIFLKEKEIKQFRNRNGHLQNFKNVNSYLLSSLQDQKQPLQQRLVELDQNMKIMYQELTDEAESEKNLDKFINETEDSIKKQKSNLNQKNDKVFQATSKLRELEATILTVLGSSDITKFQSMLKKVHKEYFINQGSAANNEEKIYQEMEQNTQVAIREELLRQRDFLSKKINTVMKSSKTNDEDKVSLIIKVQNENTQLIKNCNELRESRASLKSHLSNMQKALDIMNKEIHNLGEGEQMPIDLEEFSGEVQITEKKEFKKKISAPKLTPFQRYHQELDYNKLRRSEQTLQKAQPYRPDLNQLLKEIKMFNTTDSELREQVQQFLRHDESSSILPQIYRNPQNQSQEDTQVANMESSIINTSIETLKMQLPSIKK